MAQRVLKEELGADEENEIVVRMTVEFMLYQTA